MQYRKLCKTFYLLTGFRLLVFAQLVFFLCFWKPDQQCKGFVFKVENMIFIR